MTEKLNLKILSAEEVSNMYEKCLYFLSNKGIKVSQRPHFLKMLDKAGARVNFKNEQVIFPRDIIEEALRTVPRNITLAGKSEQHDCILPHPAGLFYTRSMTGNQFYFDSDSNTYRDTTVADVAEWGQLVEVLDQINICSFPFPQDVSGETADIHALRALFENTNKHILIQTFGDHSAEYLLELTLAVTGGAEALKARPIITIHSCPITPFVLEGMHVDIVEMAARYGAVLSSNPLQNAGATSPITIAGTVLQAGIELLSILVMSQMIKPGTPVVGQPVSFALDMATGGIRTGTSEAILGLAAMAQFVKEAFRIPVFTHGFGTESYISDGQAMIETAIKGLLVSLTSCDVLMLAGSIGLGIGASPVQLIIDNNNTKMLKRIISGVKVDEDTLAWKEILNTPPGGHYLELAHTLKHCREAVKIELFANQPKDVWDLQGSRSFYDRALEQYRELKKGLKPQPLPDDIRKELDNIVKKADKHLAK